MQQPAAAPQQLAALRVRKMRYVRFSNGAACYSAGYAAGRLRQFSSRREWLEYLGAALFMLSLILLQLYLPA
ncbi:hypothetical protein [Chromobacterium subtsugae]|uniref:hypothetical protein n=1 Tax=Chromobacterium subtsugae TaxID=251747 RepID=UPI000640BBBB|nr:hypothetical protein [Chromobacterium subtsugae]OBU84522.1 hypothetical protein MY55_21460 [Chromobacterium subtsugae]